MGYLSLVLDNPFSLKKSRHLFTLLVLEPKLIEKLMRGALNMSRVLGYMRDSTKDQNLDLKEDALKKSGVGDINE